MEDYYRERTMCINVMRNKLRFVISDNDLKLKNDNAFEICLQIDIDKQVFFNDFFNNIRTKMQLLNALNAEAESIQLLSQTKTDLSAKIKKETGCKRTLIFSIPRLDRCSM